MHYVYPIPVGSCVSSYAATVPYLSYTLSGQPLSGCPDSRYYIYLHTCNTRVYPQVERSREALAQNKSQYNTIIHIIINTRVYPKVERSREALAQTKKRVASLEHAVFIQPALATARATA